MDDPGSTLGSIILYLLFVIGCGYFAGTEISLASVNKIHMMSLADKDDNRAKRVLKILDNFDEALSVLLIGNNIMNIGCATLSVVIATRIWSSSSKTVSIATIVTTAVLFIFGEMLPKCFARSCNEKFALAVSSSLIFLMRVLKPLSAFFTAISRLVTEPFSKRATPEVTMTEDELHDIVENISEEDGIDEDTGNLVKSALMFSDRTAGEIMVPWENVLKVSMGMKTAKVLEIVQNSAHSRLPVLGRDGEIRGILHIRRFLKAYMKSNRVVLASVMDYPYYVKPDMLIGDMLKTMSNHRRNLAIVKDGKGNPLGIVTIEDILEELVGEIYDEEDIGGGANA